MVQNTRRKRRKPKVAVKIGVIAAFGIYTNQLEGLEQSTIQNEYCLKLYKACAEKRGQAPGLLDNKGFKTPVNANRTKTQPPTRRGIYIKATIHNKETDKISESIGCSQTKNSGENNPKVISKAVGENPAPKSYTALGYQNQRK